MNLSNRYTDRLRKVLLLANQEAQRLNHEYIGTEHLLLGLVKEGSGVAAHVLKNLDVDLRKIRIEAEKLLQSGPEMVTMGRLPQTPRAKQVLRYAEEEAQQLQHHYVGTEHFLLGLIRENEGVAAQVLINLGLQLDEVRKEILQLIGAGAKGRDAVGPPLDHPDSAYSPSADIPDWIPPQPARPITQLTGMAHAAIAIVLMGSAWLTSSSWYRLESTESELAGLLADRAHLQDLIATEGGDTAQPAPKVRDYLHFLEGKYSGSQRPDPLELAEMQVFLRREEWILKGESRRCWAMIIAVPLFGLGISIAIYLFWRTTSK